ncbi:MAG: glycosyltransferase [Prevotellaceae bacterium]|nr:glycosyltransferase [Prevotellaceae bacterium]
MHKFYDNIMEQLLSYFSLFEKIIIIIAFFAFVAQLYYWLGVFGRVAFFRRGTPAPRDGKNEEEAHLQPVSVIICARNEEVALGQNLPHVLAQEYPEFEVIVVNDCSEDDSEILLASMQEKYPNLIFRTIVKDEVFKHNKKMALGVGIKAARYDLLLFLDADCYPSGPYWLRRMASRFSPKTEVVLGYTRLTNNRRWIRADRLMRALHYLGKALKHKPYMGVGSNLAYRKQLFFEHKGFDIRITGNLREDCVFINKVATHDNTAVAVAPEAVNVSALRITGERWRRERREEIRSFALCEKGSRYPELAEALYRLVFFVTMTAMLIHFCEHPMMLPLLAGVVLFRMLLQLLVFFRVQRRLGERGLLLMLLLWDLVFPLFYLLLVSTSTSYRKQNVNYR